MNIIQEVKLWKMQNKINRTLERCSRIPTGDSEFPYLALMPGCLYCEEAAFKEDENIYCKLVYQT